MKGFDEVEGIAPVEEIELDGMAVGVVADAAFSDMARNKGGILPCRMTCPCRD
ncbi:MAG TPA: hypothetical protein VJN21_12430 [Candidatus Acidoferrales bacterium]|nr:hypothetical protein [Candidatus Acidoferrales bacterium]